MRTFNLCIAAHELSSSIMLIQPVPIARDNTWEIPSSGTRIHLCSRAVPLNMPLMLRKKLNFQILPLLSAISKPHLFSSGQTTARTMHWSHAHRLGCQDISTGWDCSFGGGKGRRLCNKIPRFGNYHRMVEIG